MALADSMAVGCNCCEKCESIDDNFDRSDSTDLGDDWEVASGTAEIASNKLRMAASTIAEYVRPTEVSNPDAVWVSFTHSIGTGFGDQLRCLLNYVDADNYLFFQIEKIDDSVDDYCVSLWRRSGGEDELLVRRSSSLHPSNQEKIGVYLGPDKTGTRCLMARLYDAPLSGIVTAAGLAELAIEITDPITAGVAIATGVLGSVSTLDIDDFAVIRRKGDVEDCIPVLTHQCGVSLVSKDTCDSIVIAGTWSGTTFKTTSSANAVLLSPIRAPHLRPEVARFLMRFSGPTTVRPRLIFNWIDEDNFDFMEVDPSISLHTNYTTDVHNLHLYKRVTGVESLVTSTYAPVGSGSDARFGITANRFYGEAWWRAFASSNTGGRFGYGTGPTHSGSVQFDSGWFDAQWDFDIGESCSGWPAITYPCASLLCHPETLPLQLQLTVPSGTITDLSGGDCPNCETEIQGQFLLDPGAELQHVLSTQCAWKYRFPGMPVCSLGTSGYRYQWVAGFDQANEKLIVQLQEYPNIHSAWGRIAQFEVDVTFPIDCVNGFSVWADQVSFVSDGSSVMLCEAVEDSSVLVESV